jgi:hypothetical protein
VPYIPRLDRPDFDVEIDQLVERLRENPSPGNLNYVVSSITLALIPKVGARYSGVSAYIAALNDAAAEIRRRVLDPLEDRKIAENGDLPGFVGRS